MSVKLTVVGCSPAWPNPGGAQSGYLLEDGGGRLLLDCGPGVLARLRATDADWPRVDAIVVTHWHPDHRGDLGPWGCGGGWWGRARNEPRRSSCSRPRDASACASSVPASAGRTCGSRSSSCAT